MRCSTCGAVSRGAGRCGACGAVMPLPGEELVQDRPVSVPVPLDRRGPREGGPGAAPATALARDLFLDRREEPRPAPTSVLDPVRPMAEAAAHLLRHVAAAAPLAREAPEPTPSLRGPPPLRRTPPPEATPPRPPPVAHETMPARGTPTPRPEPTPVLPGPPPAVLETIAAPVTPVPLPEPTPALRNAPIAAPEPTPALRSPSIAAPERAPVIVNSPSTAHESLPARETPAPAPEPSPVLRSPPPVALEALDFFGDETPEPPPAPTVAGPVPSVAAVEPGLGDEAWRALEADLPGDDFEVSEEILMPPAAPAWRRLVAWAIDGSLVVALPLAALALATRGVAGEDGTALRFVDLLRDNGAVQVAAVALAALTGFVYLTLSSAVGGRTPGAALAGLGVVHCASGNPPGFGRAALRAALAVAGTFAFFAGPLWALFDNRGQSLHDKLAGTVVMVDR